MYGSTKKKDGLDHKKSDFKCHQIYSAHGEVHIITRHDKDNWSREITDTGI